MRDISGRDVSASKKMKEDAFTVHPIQARTLDREEDMPQVEPLEESGMYQDPSSRQEQIEAAIDEALHPEEMEEAAPVEPKELVKVKFSKFVQLVTSHSSEEVIKNNENENVVLSSNLLTELAGSHDSREERKIPLVFLVGLAIGVVLTYIFITK